MAEQTLLIGRRIAQAREDADLTQAGLAAEIPGKADGTQVSKWERGVHRPSDDTLEHIARILKRDVAWFLVPEPNKVSTPDPFSGEPNQLDQIQLELTTLTATVSALALQLAALAETQEAGLARLERLVRGRQRPGRATGGE